jgi:hypothetical protein
MKSMRIQSYIMLLALTVSATGCTNKTPSRDTSPSPFSGVPEGPRSRAEIPSNTPAVVKASDASTVTDLDGKPVDPLAPARDRLGTVLLFITNDCPISNGYAPEIRRICESYMKQGIAFYLVYSDPSLAPADAKKHYAEYGYNCMALLDPKHELAHKAGATITPEAAVFSPAGKRLYLGRINDLYVDFGKARFQATTNDLRDVLELVAAGKPVTPHTTTAIGCTIPL